MPYLLLGTFGGIIIFVNHKSLYTAIRIERCQGRIDLLFLVFVAAIIVAAIRFILANVVVFDDVLIIVDCQLSIVDCRSSIVDRSCSPSCGRRHRRRHR